MWSACLIALALAVPAAPAPPSRAEADSLRRVIEKDREDTRTWLKSGETSYLATILRRDFEERLSLTVGSAADNDVRLPADSIAAHHLRVTVAGDSFRVEALDPEARFAVRGEFLRQATLGPSGIRLGRFGLRLSHQRFPALIVFDPQSPRYALYKGIDYFPVDLAYRYVLPLIPNPEPDTTLIFSTRGHPRRAARVGWFEFRSGGRTCRLEAVRLLEPGVSERDFGIFFRDATSGKESYELGRYVDVSPAPDGRFVLDFNLAYNPACAYSDHYNCPIPPRANTLKVAIRAGEKDSHYPPH